MKISPPKEFTGKGDYEEFSKKLRAYMCLSDQRFGLLLRWVETCQDPITMEVVNTRFQPDGDQVTTEAWETHNPMLYYTLASLVTGPPYTIIDRVPEGNGLEAYRQLHLRYSKSNMQTAMMRLCTIVETKFNSEKDFETTFANWESEIARFEFALQKDLYDEIKVGLLIAGTTGKLHDHLCFTLGDKVDYKAVRETVISYFKSKSLTTERGYGGAEPMDIGYNYYYFLNIA